VPCENVCGGGDAVRVNVWCGVVAKPKMGRTEEHDGVASFVAKTRFKPPFAFLPPPKQG